MQRLMRWFARSLFGQGAAVPAAANQQIITFGPVLWFMNKLLGRRARNLDDGIVQQPQPRLARLRVEHRGSRSVREGQIMRREMERLWSGQAEWRTPIAAHKDELWKLYVERKLGRKKQDYLLAGLLEQMAAQRNLSVLISFSPGTDHADHKWNAGMAAYVIKNELIEAINGELGGLEGVQRGWDDKVWVLSMMDKITKHVQYVFKRETNRNAVNQQSREEGVRRRELERRLQAVSDTPDQVRALRLLGVDGMSSDGEDFPEDYGERPTHARVIHPHPWRARVLETVIRHASRLVNLMYNATPRRGNVRNERRFVPGKSDQHPRLHSTRWRDMRVPPHLPENFYNWGYLNGHASFATNAREILQPTAAIPLGMAAE
ncbi:hypothetical protein V5O48_013797 [Marasmius crinis-equi]|uniref:Uncharacterized protein n=1 Tax=Marasmius crinis-equi TaxID=585013 RepID=A0ABR3EZ30_9AGAR